MKFHPSIAGALLSLPMTAFAAEQAGPATGFVDLYYVPSSTLTITGPGIPGDLKSDGGSGYGLRGRVAVTPMFFVQGEFQQDSYDGFEGVTLNTDASQFRFGGGIMSSVGVYGSAELVSQKIDIDATPVTPASSTKDNGYALHVGLEGHPGTPDLTLFGELGYNDVGDFGNGVDFNAGAAFKFTPVFGLFADFRQFQQKDDSGAQGKFQDFRVGARFAFGS